MPYTLGRCQCLGAINKSIILEALSKEDTRLFLEINRLRENREELGSQIVDAQIPILQRLRNHVSEVTVKVRDTQYVNR